MADWNKTRNFLSQQLDRWWRDCCVAGGFLTRLPFPAPKDGAGKGALAGSSRAFPVIGAAVGAIAGLALRGQIAEIPSEHHEAAAVEGWIALPARH